MSNYLYSASYHVTYAFQNESTLHSCLSVKGLLALAHAQCTPYTNDYLMKKLLAKKFVFVTSSRF